jgi:hypothetical protein
MFSGLQDFTKIIEILHGISTSNCSFSDFTNSGDRYQLKKLLIFNWINCKLVAVDATLKQQLAALMQ